MDERNSFGNLAVSFLVGAAAGLVLGILYAPRAGRETRHRIVETGQETRETTEKIIREAQEKAAKIVEQGRARAEALLHRSERKPGEEEMDVREAG